MKKGLVIGLVLVVLAGVGFLATTSPKKLGLDRHAETAADMTAAPPAAEQPAPAATPPPAETAAAPVQTPAPAGPDVTGDAVDVNLAMTERILGNPAAPVTIIEYASLTCPHCAHFAETILPEVKKRLIETGKARLIFRDFPLDGMAMKAAKLSRCAPHDKYFDFLEVLFKNRDRWLGSENPENSLKQLGALTGMSDTYMTNCIGNAELDTALLTVLNDGQQKFALKSTPSFVFNYGAETFAGAQPIEKFEETVLRLSTQPAPAAETPVQEKQ